MMKLSNMKKIVETVDKEWRSPIAERILERWGYDQDSVYYFRASSNFVFIFKKDGKRRFLRFIHSEERKKASIEAEIKLLIYLKDHSIKAAEPVLSMKQQYVETFETEGGTLHAVVFEGIGGDHYGLEKMDIDQFQSWGAALGELHQVLKDVPLSIQAERGSWEEHASLLKKLLPKEEDTVLRELERVEEWAKGLPVSKENYGLIHYDFELDNLCWKDGRAGILDFDDSACYWYAADIALALRDLLEEGSTGNQAGYQSFLNGYKSRRSSHDPLLQELSWFIRMHKIVQFGKLYRSVDIEESSENPKWLNELRGKLVLKMEELKKNFDRV